jgi:epsin
VPAPAPQAAARPQTVGQFASPPSYSNYSPAPSTQASQPAMTSRPSYTSTASNAAPTPSALSPKPTGGSSTFDDLWTTSLSSLGPGAAAAAGKTSAPKKSINDLEREKAMNKLWGPSPSAAPVQSQQNQFGQGSSGAPAQSSGGGDDLLL